MVSEEHIIAFNWAGQQDIDDMIALALRVNDFLSGMFLGVGIRLIDFKIEIGRVYDGDFQRLIVADEISPDSAGSGTSRPGASSTRTSSARTSATLSDAYTEVARRLGVMPKTNGRTHTGPKLVN